MKKLERMYDKLSSLKIDAEAMLEKAQENYDNHSDAWQESERGEEAQEVIDALEGVVDGLESAAESLEGVI